MREQSAEIKKLLAEFENEHIAYAQACSVLAKLRLAADDSAASNDTLAEYAKARKKHKEICRIYHAARADFSGAMKRLSTKPIDQAKAQAQAYAHAHTDKEFMTYEDILHAKTQHIIAEEVGSGMYDSLITELKQKMNGGAAATCPVLDTPEVQKLRSAEVAPEPNGSIDVSEIQRPILRHNAPALEELSDEF